MQENNSENNTNKTPHKMARLAWPKAKYGAILAIIIIIIINLIYYKDFFLSFLNNCVNLKYGKKFISNC